jgi:RHS repeat-associated protein
VVITKKVYLCPVKPKRIQTFPQQKTAQMTNCQRYNSKSADYGGYRYFFNGQEADNEVFGELAFQNYGFRMYDTRVARFWGVDPLTKDYPMLTPFQFASCSPMLLKDVEGLEGEGNTIGYTSDGIPFYYLNARQTTYIQPIALPEVALKKPKLRLGNNYYKPPAWGIRPAKSVYEKWWEFTAGPFANSIRTDRVLQSVSAGIFTAATLSYGEIIVTQSLPYVMDVAKPISSSYVKWFGDTRVKIGIGIMDGVVSYNLDLPPDLSWPDPVVTFTSQITQLGIKEFVKNNFFENLKTKQDTNDNHSKKQ